MDRRHFLGLLAATPLAGVLPAKAAEPKKQVRVNDPWVLLDSPRQPHGLILHAEGVSTHRSWHRDVATKRLFVSNMLQVRLTGVVLTDQRHREILLRYGDVANASAEYTIQVGMPQGRSEVTLARMTHVILTEISGVSENGSLAFVGLDRVQAVPPNEDGWQLVPVN